jgi:hypothetical protein
VEADGASYRDSGSVRDRDRLRKEHLERLGWRFHRLWSTNWFRDPDAEVAKLSEAYDQAVAASPHPTPSRPYPPSLPRPPSLRRPQKTPSPSGRPLARIPSRGSGVTAEATCPAALKIVETYPPESAGYDPQ